MKKVSTVSVCLPEELVHALDRQSERLSVSRSSLVTALLKLGVEAMEGYHHGEN